MSENLKRNRVISFRVSEEELAKIEKTAQSNGKNSNDWCRDLVLLEAGVENSLNANDKIIFEEIAKIRYLLSIGFGLLSTADLNSEKWSETKKLVDEKGGEIAEALLKEESNRFIYGFSEKSSLCSQTNLTLKSHKLNKFSVVKTC